MCHYFTTVFLVGTDQTTAAIITEPTIINSEWVLVGEPKEQITM
jgi:hypothetical protein